MAFIPSKPGSENDNPVVQSGTDNFPSGFAGKKAVHSDKSAKHAVDSKGKHGEAQTAGHKAANVDDKLSDQATTKKLHGRGVKRKDDEDDSDQWHSLDDVLADQTDGDAQQAGNSDGQMLLAAADTGAADATSSPVGGTADAGAAGAAGGVDATAGSGAAAPGAVADTSAAGFSVGTIIGTAVVVGIAAASGGGGGGGAAAATGFTLSGTIVLGKINDATGLVVEAFKADGTQLAGTGTVNADGTFSIAVTENYSGPVLIRLKDTSAGTNYIDEGTGAAKDLATDLRAVVNVSGNGTITVAITPLTELAVRELVGDSGGDAGTASTTLGSSVTTTQVTTANDNVKTAFGLSGDITTTIPVTVDDATAFNAGTAAQKAYGQVLAAIAGAEVDQGLSAGEVLTSLSQDLVGSTLSISSIEELLAGAAVADSVGTNVTGTAAALDTLIGTNIGNVHLSADTGNASDFITQTVAQTITGTLDAALSATKLWGSVDGGTTWTDISSFVTATSLAWTGVTLGNGDNQIKFAVTADTVSAFTGATASVVGKVSAQSYSVDTANPVFSSATSASFAENDTSTVYAAAATDAHLLSYTLGGSDAALFNIDASSGVVTFKSAPNFEAPADANTDNIFNIDVTATDVAGNATTQSVAITVTNVNEAPSLTSGATASLAEDATGTVYTATATDPDAGTTLTYALGGTDAALFNINASTGAITFKTAPDFEAPADVGGNNVYDVTVTASDGAITTSAQAVAITVTNVNEAPTLTSGASVSFAENGTGAAYTVTAADPEAAALTYALGGTDAALFNINSSTGAITFQAAPNFEAPADAGGNNVYDVTVTASDGVFTTSDQAVAITVTNVNEAPTSTAVTAPIGVTNQAYSLDVSGNFADPDANDTLAFSATGLPSGLGISSTTGVISGAATTEGLTNSVTVTATDGGGLTTSQTFNLPVVSAPVITGITANVAQAMSGDALTFTATLTEAVTVTGTPTLTFDVGGQSLTATYSSGTGTNSLIFTTTAATGDDASVTVSAISVGDGSVMGNTSGQPLVTTAVGQTVTAFVIDNTAPSFTSGATADYAENGTAAAYTSAVSDLTAVTYTLGGADASLFDLSSAGAVTFKTSPNFEAPADAGADNVYNISVTATDALAQATTQTVAITVTNVNETPTLTSGASASFAENGTGTVHTVTATDPDAGTTLTYALGGTDAALFSINSSTGVVTFATAPNFEAPVDAGGNNVYDVTVTASDGTNTTPAQAVAITVTNVNETPTLTSGASASFAENGTGTAYTVTATDPEAATLTYALGGTDAALFNINASTGAVTFQAAPNFEAPADAGGNNVYDVTVTASDGVNTTSAQAVAITVTGVNEAPTSIPSTSTATLVVNQPLNDNIADLFSDVDFGDTLTFTATGLPTTITLATNGGLSGTPTATGTAEVVFTATDSGGLTATHTATVSIVSAPVIASTIDNVTNFEVTSNIVLAASENVTAVAGKYIHIINDGGTGFHGEATVNTQDILVTDASVTISNNTITINPGFDLDFANNYHIMVDEGAFLGVSSGQGSVVTADAAALNFSTVNPSATATATASQAMNSSTDAMVAGHSWWDAEGNGVPGGTPAARDFSGGNFAITANDLATNGIATNDFYIAVNNFGAGDLIYVDNHGDNAVQRQGDFDSGLIIDFGTPPTLIVTGASGTATGLSGGQFDVTIEGSSATFSDTSALQVLLGGVSYEPILYG